MEEKEAGRRPVRSFVLRGGRLTEGQKRALEEFWPRFGIEKGESPLDFKTLFGNDAPVIMEIGFGNGDATWQMAQAQSSGELPGRGSTPTGCRAPVAENETAWDHAISVLPMTTPWNFARASPGRIAGRREDLLSRSLAKEAASQKAAHPALINRFTGFQDAPGRPVAPGHRLGALCGAYAGSHAVVRWFCKPVPVRGFLRSAGVAAGDQVRKAW